MISSSSEDSESDEVDVQSSSERAIVVTPASKSPLDYKDYTEPSREVDETVKMTRRG